MDLSDPQFTAEFWGWANRLSAATGILGGIAGIVGLFVAFKIGLPQLAHIRDEQRRLADEQTRRPSLRVGFDSADPFDLSTLQELTISPNWPADRLHSQAVTLVVTTLNVGTKSARDLFWTFVFEDFPEQGQVMSPYDAPMYAVIRPGMSEGAEPLQVVPDPRGWVRMVSRLPYLHPGTWQKYGFIVHVPREQLSVKLMVLVSAADIELHQVDLTVHVDAVHEGA
jgi:hypothetical protein